jgi:hypothetical protein
MNSTQNSNMLYKSNGFVFFILSLIFTIMNMRVIIETTGDNVDLRGPGGWPSTTGNPSGGGRNNGRGPGGWPSTTGNPSGGGRNNGPR